MGKVALAEKLNLSSTDNELVIHAAEKRIAELEAENAKLKSVISGLIEGIDLIDEMEEGVAHIGDSLGGCMLLARECASQRPR